MDTYIPTIETLRGNTKSELNAAFKRAVEAAANTTAATSPLRARWPRCTGWLCMIVKITWSLRRAAEVEEIGE